MTRRRRLRARDRRAVILGLIVIAPFAGYRVGVAPWLEYRAGLSEALVAERDLFAREQAAVADTELLPSYETELSAALDDAEGWIFDGATEVASTGQLSRRVTQLGQAVGVLVQEVRSSASENEFDSLQETSVAVRIVGDLEGIARFLLGLENGAQLLRVEGLTLQPAGLNDGDLERGQLMAAAFTVTGYWRTNAAPAPEAGHPDRGEAP